MSNVFEECEIGGGKYHCERHAQKVCAEGMNLLAESHMLLENSTEEVKAISNSAKLSRIQRNFHLQEKNNHLPYFTIFM